MHWINEQFLSIRDLTKIKKKVLWTHHDTWAFCGTEHYPNILENDRRWAEGYTSVNCPATTRGLDLDKWIYLWKKHCWKDLRFHFSAPSRWEADLLENSALFCSQTCTVIPNCVDVEIFSPGDQLDARTKWNLPQDCKIILFGAVSLQDPVKGSQYLLKAVQQVCKKDPSVFLVCFGKGDVQCFTELGIECISAGQIQGDKCLASLYRSADVFVCPSIIENLPNTCVEASACGIPVAAFRTGGIPDVIQHRKTGYQANPFDTDQLTEGIEYCLQNKSTLGSEARRYALAHFSSRTVASKFYNLYKIIMQEQ